MKMFTPHIKAVASLSIWAYFCSDAVRVREAKAIGRSTPFEIVCDSTAPSP